MATLKLYSEKLKHNYQFLDEKLKKKGVEWGVVTKLLCGNKRFINEVLALGVKEAHDSRISNLKKIKMMDPDIQTVYIKPPSRSAIPDIISYADVSFNTEFDTIKALSDEAVKQNKKHKIIIMIEMGDLREGVMGEDLVDFYGEIFRLPHIYISGLGTNLNCLTGVMPSEDKLIQLSLYKQIIEARFGREIPWVSGGTSVTLPLFLNNRLPKGINHFRIGESLYFGANLFTGKTIPGMERNVFQLDTEIIEITLKPMVPQGDLGSNPSGDTAEIDESLYGKTSYRAIIDIGLLDINPKYLIPEDDKVKVVGASSDMLVVELGENKQNYKVGDILTFGLEYMGALSILNSNYIDKKIERGESESSSSGKNFQLQAQQKSGT